MRKENKNFCQLINIIYNAFVYMIMLRLNLYKFSSVSSINKNKNTQMEENKNIDLPTKYTSFEKLCPIWARKLFVGLDKMDKFTIERDSKYCIVGEAWKFSGKYTGYYLAPLIPLVGCWTCISYARKFARISKNKNIKHHLTRNDFEPLTEFFVNHWNEKHLKKT